MNQEQFKWKISDLGWDRNESDSLQAPGSWDWEELLCSNILAVITLLLALLSPVLLKEEDKGKGHKWLQAATAP